MMLRRRFLASVLVLPLLSAGAAAQDNWPSKPIKIIVPFAAGGNTDTIARLAGERLGKALSATIVVENMGGGGGIPASNAVMRSEPDGHTLYIVSSPQFAIVPAIQKVPYNPLTDFTPIKNITLNPFVLVVHKSVPAKDLKEIIAWAKPQSGKLTYASGGMGGIGHLSAELLFSRIGVKASPVHYRGNAPAQVDVVSGQLPLIFSNLLDALSQSNNPDVRLLAVTSTKRVVQLPEVATMQEQGIPDYEIVAWNGFVGPAKMPPSIVGRIEKILIEYLQEPATAKRFTELGIEPDLRPASQFGELIKADIKNWENIVKIAGVKQP